eukprot:2512143-Alexandrium_andersonii.AAC.1
MRVSDALELSALRGRAPALPFPTPSGKLGPEESLEPPPSRAIVLGRPRRQSVPALAPRGRCLRGRRQRQGAPGRRVRAAAPGRG